jgi:hypothetical protein
MAISTGISIVPFLGDAVFEPADIKVMSDAYGTAIEFVSGFGHPNRIVREIIAERIVKLTKSGERDPNHLREKALAACGFRLSANDPAKK